MTRITFQHGDITGVRTLVLLQGVVCIVLGALLVAAPPPSIQGIVLLLGGYWMVRGFATVGHAYAEPNQWAGKGLVAILGITAGLLVLQAPLIGAFPIGMSIILFLGAQALISGAIEMISGVRNGTPPLSILGLASSFLGALLLMGVFFAMPGLAMALGMIAIVGGSLATYAALRLPMDRKAITYGPRPG